MDLTTLSLQIGVPILATLIFGTLLARYLSRRHEYREWIRDAIYRPLFNEAILISQVNGRVENSDDQTAADSVDEFTRMQITDKDLLNRIDAYRSKFAESRNATIREEEFRQHPPHELLARVNNAIPEELRWKQDESQEFDHILLERREQSVSYWEVEYLAGEYWESVFNSDDAAALGRELSSEAKKRGQLQYVATWAEQYPEFLEGLVMAFRSDSVRREFRQIRTSRANLNSEADLMLELLKRRVRRLLW